MCLRMAFGLSYPFLLPNQCHAVKPTKLKLSSAPRHARFAVDGIAKTNCTLILMGDFSISVQSQKE